MSDEKPRTPNPDSQTVTPGGGFRTLGGRQLWGDVCFFHGWRIQHNVITKHYRLLDPEDVRHASGTRQECDEKLNLIRLDHKLPPMSGKAVILIHGIGRSSKCFAGMSKKLAEDGYTVIGFDYPSTRVSIPESAAYLQDVIGSLAGIETIDVVGHSMGGIILRACLQSHEEKRFRRAVMLGVPNKGAEMADSFKNNALFKLFLGPAGQQLASDSEGLIGQLPTPDFPFGILAGGRSAAKGFNPLLSGDNDSTVTVASTRLPGAADFVLLPVIHSLLMTDKRAIEATRHFLQHGCFDPNRELQPIAEDDVTVVR